MRITVTNDDFDGNKRITVRALKRDGKDAYTPAQLDGGDSMSFTIDKGERLDVRECEDK